MFVLAFCVFYKRHYAEQVVPALEKFMVARLIGLSVLRPAQPNRAFEMLKNKFFCDGGRKNVGNGYEGKGLRVLPAPESEKPR